MTGRVEGKVAFITGGARGQGRSHAVRLAEEGADVALFDFCGDAPTTSYEMGTKEDLEETADQVRAVGRRAITVIGDVRVQGDLDDAVRQAVADLGRVDIAVANAGIVSWAAIHKIGDQQWEDTIATNLTGVWKTIKAVTPTMLEQGSGSIVVISSGAGITAPNNMAHYASAKHGLEGLMKVASNELSPQGIRVNSVHPTQVDTPMIMHDSMFQLFRPELENPGREDIVEISTNLHTIPIPWVEAIDVSNAVLFLASDEARYVTGVMLPVDAGGSIKSVY